MSRIRVGVKFCGHCNPCFEGKSLIESVAALDEHIDFISWSEADKTALLIVGCCPTSCADRPPFDGPVVHVAGNSLNGRPLPWPEMASAIAATIRDQAGSGNGQH